MSSAVDPNANPVADPHHDSAHGAAHHVVSVKFMLAIFAALMVLTVLTVAAIQLDLGRAGNVILALGIAAIKAFLVGAFFMHLWWDRPFNAYILCASIGFVVLFIGWTMIDVGENLPRVEQADYDQRLELRAAP